MNKVLIVEAIFYKDISENLLEGAQNYLKNVNFEWETIQVPGALEIPTVISIVENQQKSLYKGYIALGCVIRGDTTHYDYVCSESARGLMDLGVKDNICIGNGILTVENREQADRRADVNQMDKGGFAARACVDLINIKERFSKQPNQTS